MVCDHIENLASCPLPEGLRDFIEQIPQLATQPAGRYPLDGDRVFAMVQEMQTAPVGEQRYEAHAKYLDVQYLVSGEEGIGYLPRSARVDISEDALASRDIAFYQHHQTGCDLVLSPGMFAVFQPGEYHRPGLAPRQPMAIRKVVLKWRPEEGK